MMPVIFLAKFSQNWVVTPSRGDRNASRQQVLERPAMIGQPQSHRRRPVVITMHAIRKRHPQGPMGSMKVVIEELQAHERIPGRIAFGEGVRLAREGIEPITQGAIEPFHMHGPGWLHPYPQRGTDFHREQSSVLITMLDGLRQGECLGDSQPRTSPFARQAALAVGPLEDAPIAVPTIAEPVQFALMGPLDRGGHCLLDQVLAQRTGGAGHHETTVPILDEASPAFSLVRLSLCAFFFCTNDQNSSISTWLSCRSLASTCVMASAWLAARLSHRLMVSYLWPVISSAPRKLPRRITIKRAWATSAAGVFNPYMGVPCVCPKYVLQVRQW